MTGGVLRSLPDGYTLGLMGNGQKRSACPCSASFLMTR